MYNLCPYCNSSGTSKLKFVDGRPVEIRLKNDERLYSQTASIVICPSCKRDHLLTMEYNEEGNTFLRERSFDYFEIEEQDKIKISGENPIFEFKLKGIDREIEFKIEGGIYKQYTGLKDKNENKIYEGDKILFKDKFLEDEGIVKWKDSYSCFLIHFKGKCIYSLSKENIQCIEIVK